MPRFILIVDDSPQMAANLEIALSTLDGLETRVVHSAVDALSEMSALGCGAVAAVVTDLEMPRMNGFELIERLRADPRFGRRPIIVSSGSPDPDSPGRAARLGADAYFTKPYSPIELRRKLQKLLEEHDHS